ncbi:MAG TPA: hypothetical protein VLF66_06600 [Thermoanaerobaculia bacterium]|nr:hypothetical protein [Thermoanaerobaculia bacterium]
MITHSRWTIDEGAFPAAGSWGAKARFLLRYAVLAPSTQNTQPWLFSVRGATIDVYADPERWLHVTDRDHRELQISVGCALENLLVAAERFGLSHRTELVPDRFAPDLLASVTLEPAGAPSPARPPELFGAIARRATNREPYRDEPVPEELLARLRASSEDGVQLVLTGDAEARAWVEMLIEATDERQLADPLWREQMAWLHAAGVLDEERAAFRCDARTFATAPLLGLVISLDDEPATRVRAGQVFERIHLTATALGLALQPVSQLLELGPAKEALGNVLGLGASFPQQPFRLGFGPPPGPPEPRRPVEEVLIVREPVVPA